MRKGLAVTVTAFVAAIAMLSAQDGAGPESVAEPYKLGTFEINGVPKVGMVLRDSLVVDIEAANADLQRSRPAYVSIQMPVEMRALIGQYEKGVASRLYEIVNMLDGSNRLEDGSRAKYVYDLASVRTLAPILYPTNLLNVVDNYYGDVKQGGTPEEQRKIAERRKNRGMPYLFLKPTVGAIVGNTHDIVLPQGREQSDWECEIGVVIGRPAKNVPGDKAKDYIFGYTIVLDMSDPGDRPVQKDRPDKFQQKPSDTSAPMGPWIVPKEFYPDPMNVVQRLTVNGKVMQDAVSSAMIHNIYELLKYTSSVMALNPGDVISAGGTANTGMSGSVRPAQGRLNSGDKIVATIGGIGTLTHTVVAGKGATPNR